MIGPASMRQPQEEFMKWRISWREGTREALKKTLMEIANGKMDGANRLIMRLFVCIFPLLTHCVPTDNIATHSGNASYSCGSVLECEKYFVMRENYNYLVLTITLLI